MRTGISCGAGSDCARRDKDGVVARLNRRDLGGVPYSGRPVISSLAPAMPHYPNANASIPHSPFCSLHPLEVLHCQNGHRGVSWPWIWRAALPQGAALISGLWCSSVSGFAPFKFFALLVIRPPEPISSPFNPRDWTSPHRRRAPPTEVPRVDSRHREPSQAPLTTLEPPPTACWGQVGGWNWRAVDTNPPPVINRRF